MGTKKVVDISYIFLPNHVKWVLNPIPNDDPRERRVLLVDIFPFVPDLNGIISREHFYEKHNVENSSEWL